MNDIPHDRISDGLRESAETIDVGDPDARLVDIRRRARQRTNRRRSAVGALCAVALVGVGVVVVNDADDDGDIIRSADVADEATGKDDDERAADPAPATTTTTIAPPPEAAAAEAAEATNADIAFGDGIEFVEGPQWLVPWRDGFLAGTARYEPPMLPAELPTEVAALFPQDVLDLFVPDLPMPIDEAFERISMAGHEDLIEAAFSESPEVMESLYGDPGPPNVEFEFSTDGADWAPIEIVLPEGVSDISQLTSVGDRVVIVSHTYPRVPDGTGVDVPSPEVAVHSSTDLATWTSQVLPASGRDDLPDAVRMHRWPQQIAVQDDRWMLSLEGNIDLDVESLVSDEVREQMGREGWGYMPTDDGMTVELYDEQGSVETIDFTWAELGISPQLAAELRNGGYAVEVWTAPWDGVATRAASPFSTAEPGGRIVAVGSGFVSVGANTSFSIDGASWEPLAGAPDDVWVSATIAVDGGVLAFADGLDGPAIYRIDASLGWSPVEIPGAPERLYPAFGDGQTSGAVVVVVDAEVVDMPEPEPVEISITAGDFTLVLDDGPSEQTYRVLDAAGTVVTTETWSYDETTGDIGDTGPFEFLLYEENGITALSPDDGSVLFEIGYDTLSETYEEAYGVDEPAMEGPEVEVDPWLLATADGTNWLVEQLDADPMYWQIQTARNGSTVLVSTGDEWLTYELP